MLWLSDKNGWPPVVSSQIPFSMLRREFQNDLPFCEQHGIGVTPYQSLQGGLLTGKYRRGEAPAANTRAAEKPDWIWAQSDSLFDKLEAIEALAAEAGVTMGSYSLAWTLLQPAMSSLVVGVKSLEQIRQAVATAETAIPEDQLAKIDAICPPPWQQNDPVRG